MAVAQNLRARVTQVLVHVSTCQGSVLEFRFFSHTHIFYTASIHKPTDRKKVFAGSHAPVPFEDRRRSFLLVSVTSDILRFAYLLCVDAWRADAFEARLQMFRAAVDVANVWYVTWNTM